MGLFDMFKKKEMRRTSEQANTVEDALLDDITFIRDMKHLCTGPWHQYDILLEARGYGWDMMLDWADYMASADLDHISEVTVGTMGIEQGNITKQYHENGGKLVGSEIAATEYGMLSIAGQSKALKAPTKIVWINQTRMLRVFTLLDDELLIKKYVETAVRRTFGTEDAMKLGKPIPEGK